MITTQTLTQPGSQSVQISSPVSEPAQVIAQTADNLWVLVAAILVFGMNLGFACLETGLTRAKNATNVLFKNTVTPLISLLIFGFCGYGIMYPGEASSGQILGFGGFGLIENELNSVGIASWSVFLFQAMFAATAVTIVSGAVAERIRLKSYLFFSVLMVVFIYPVVGMWIWGDGWMAHFLPPFHDFAGSTVVHSVGGWAALAGIIMVGPRFGKYVGKRILPIQGHNLTLATIGVFVLWFGWFGFNGGSVGSADPLKVSSVLVNTCLSASAAGLSAMFTSWLFTSKPDHTMMLNGILAGLVSVTASADQVSFYESALIGFVGGILVVLSVLFLDKRKLDDPVGAVPVHLTTGIWGTLAVGIFGSLAGWHQFGVQLTGIFIVGIYAFGLSLLFFYLIGKFSGLRVSVSDEFDGLDLREHGLSAYPEFTLNQR
ncbi:MAG: ammonium transporter [Bacteroidetes bacterium]|nr:ammonium transporter [Bacteroidota bacterium]